MAANKGLSACGYRNGHLDETLTEEGKASSLLVPIMSFPVTSAGCPHLSGPVTQWPGGAAPAASYHPTLEESRHVTQRSPYYYHGE